MASKASAAIALLLSLNLLFSMANAGTITLSECAKVDVNVCVNVFGLLGGVTPGCSCCSLIAHLIEVEAEVCLCAIVKADILGLIALEANVQLGKLISACGLQLSKPCNC